VVGGGFIVFCGSGVGWWLLFCVIPF